VVLAGIAVALSAVLLVMMYGESSLYQGALKWRPTYKVRRVAQVTCKSDASLEGRLCAYTLEPIQYFVMKDGENYIIYGPKETDPTKITDPIKKILTDNNIELNVGDNLYNAWSYSLLRAQNSVEMKMGFKFIERDGVQSPAFTIDAATAKTLTGVKSVEVELPRSVKIRFNSFYLPK